MPWQQLQAALAQLDAHMQQREHAAMRALLQQLVSGYQPNDPLVDWAHQARQQARQQASQQPLVADAAH